MTHNQLKKAVMRSFMWSLAFDLNKTVFDDVDITMMQRIAVKGAITSIVNIMLAENKKHAKNMVDDIEEIKMATWNELAERYREHETIANIPTMIEELYYLNYDWMSKIKNLEKNIHIMSRLAIDKTVVPKVSRVVTDEYEHILSKHIYRYLKNKEIAA